jgi:hypothetical protein
MSLLEAWDYEVGENPAQKPESRARVLENIGESI